ncbi:MAG: hypothetical protein ABEJ89_05385 [Haloarculaceae archaeon]
MSLQATTPVDATAAVSLRVPRGEAGDLESGVAEVLESVESVETVAVDQVTGVRPTWTDLRVDVDARFTVRVPADHDDRVATVRELLADGFGVTEVTGLIVDTGE